MDVSTPSGQTDLREVAVRLVEDLDDHVHLVHLSVVSQLLPDATEDLGEGPLAQTVVLKRIDSGFEKLLLTGSGLSFIRTVGTFSLTKSNRKVLRLQLQWFSCDRRVLLIQDSESKENVPAGTVSALSHVEQPFSYQDQVFSSDLMENHLADVVCVQRLRQRKLCSLTVSAHQQVGFI